MSDVSAENVAPGPDRRARILLVSGALLGIVLTALGVLRDPGEAPVPSDAVAVVNGQPISRESFDRLVLAVASERRRPRLEEDSRRRLLERAIDEELLLQRGIALGLARHEPTARRMIVQSVIASVAGAAETEEPDDAALREFFESEQERFVRPGRFAVEALRVPSAGRSDAATREVADRLTRELRAGASIASLLAPGPGAPGDPVRGLVPEGLLPIEAVREYLGPTAAAAVRALPEGGVAEPLRTVDGYRVLRVAERTPDRVPPFLEIRDQVRAAYLRTLGERAVASFLEDLRAEAEIERLDPAAGRP